MGQKQVKEYTEDAHEKRQSFDCNNAFPSRNGVHDDINKLEERDFHYNLAFLIKYGHLDIFSPIAINAKNYYKRCGPKTPPRMYN